MTRLRHRSLDIVARWDAPCGLLSTGFKDCERLRGYNQIQRLAAPFNIAAHHRKVFYVALGLKGKKGRKKEKTKQRKHHTA